MPRATVSLEAQTFELKTLEGAYVKLRALSYGQKKERADRAGTMYMEATGRKNSRAAISSKMFMESANRAATAYDYAHCVVDHNLEDENERKLDFTRPGTLDSLDPRVGGEIEDLMARLNGDDEDMQDFLNESSDSPPPE